MVGGWKAQVAVALAAELVGVRHHLILQSRGVEIGDLPRLVRVVAGSATYARPLLTVRRNRVRGEGKIAGGEEIIQGRSFITSCERDRGRGVAANTILRIGAVDHVVWR